MTASEWGPCADPIAMLSAVMPGAGFRKRQLFCLGVWAGVADLLTDERCQEALTYLNTHSDESRRDQGRNEYEAFEDSLADLDLELSHRFWDLIAEVDTELEEAWSSGTEGRLTTWSGTDSVRAGAAIASVAVVEGWVVRSLYRSGVYCATPMEFATRVMANATAGRRSAEAWRESQRAHADLLRELFGNPFRPVPFPSSWRTDAVRSLARQMYESQDFGAMPILADALQDAGCDDEEMLNHCRDARQTHVRGCWVVDAVFGEYYIAKRW